VLRTRTVAVAALLVASVAFQMGGCLSSGSDNSRDTDKPVQGPQPPSSQPGPGKPTAPKNPDAKRDREGEVMTLTGVLRGGIVAIGAEHTGWQLERDGGLPPQELGVARVQEAVKKLDGKRVQVTGRLIDKKYTERGLVKIFRVNTITEVKSERY
jgi:hypothetical protein